MRFFRILSLLLVLSPVSLQAADIELGLSDEELLDLIQRQGFEYFVMERDQRTGLVRDRAHNFKRSAKQGPASIAAVGFALTVYPVAVERDWMDVETAKEITLRTLRFALQSVEHEHGFFYHFIQMRTGERAYNSEVSPIDTALFLAGALFAAEYYEDQKIRELAMKIYERVDWTWARRGGDFVALGWSPEEGFHKLFWDHYDESMILQFLAMASPTYPLPTETWDKIKRPVGSYGGYRLIQMPPLFTHQYSHIWIDFRNKHDKHADYFKNSVYAAKANRQFCIDQAAKHKSYGVNSWGLTASDGPFGYKAYGAPPGWADHDGTIAPTGCGASIVFTPEESIACLRYFYEQLGEKLWGLYGFADSFNLDRDWVASDVIALDQAAMILMIENYRTGFVWETMKKNKPLQDVMTAVGFVEGTREVAWPDPPSIKAPYILGGIKPDGFLRDWPHTETLVLDQSNLESGDVEDDDDLKAEIAFAWDEQALYFYVKVRDQNVLARKSRGNIWLDDLLELFIDPEGDGLVWYGEDDFQIGVRPDDETGGVGTWSWFQGGEDPQEEGALLGGSFIDDEGYLIEGMIRWDYLTIVPRAGLSVAINPSVHDIDRDRRHGKVNWFMRSEKGFRQFRLGNLILQAQEPKIHES